MPRLSEIQLRRLSSHRQTRDGIVVPASEAATPFACWNFALTGTLVGMLDPNSTQNVFEDSMFDIDNFAASPVCRGLRPTATLARFPGCGAELDTINANLANAQAGNADAQQAIQLAMLGILVRLNGLTPSPADSTYKIHMRSTTWFGWDHFSLSVRPGFLGGDRIHIQTITGRPLKHACTTIWDEDLSEVSMNILELHLTQITLINLVTTYGDLCVTCGAAEGRATRASRWYRCDRCGAQYCQRHGRSVRHNPLGTPDRCTESCSGRIVHTG